MKAKARAPPRHHKLTPSNFPELLGAYIEVFNEFRETYNQSKSLELTAQRFGISVTTARYHLFPRDKEKKKSRNHARYGKNRATTNYKRPPDYKRRYQNLRNHADEAVRQAFADADQPMTMDEISDAIQEQRGISMSPDTICGLLDRHEAKYGAKVLHVTPGSVPPTYTLAPGYKP